MNLEVSLPSRASSSRPYPALKPGFFLSLYSHSWLFLRHQPQVRCPLSPTNFSFLHNPSTSSTLTFDLPSLAQLTRHRHRSLPLPSPLMALLVPACALVPAPVLILFTIAMGTTGGRPVQGPSGRRTILLASTAHLIDLPW